MTTLIADVRMFTTTIFCSGLFLILVVGTFIMGPSLEASWLPVMKNMTITKLRDTENSVTYSVSGTKSRKCKFLEIVALVYKDDIWQQASVSYSGAPNPLLSRPTGTQKFSDWTVSPKGNPIRLEAHYQCHPLWVSITDLGEVEGK